ncbi:enterotoxin [Scleromatobacter humisilvae]|uniref:Enterotoxin n=1 Tax=Scleromatobacter humisilvae TaxID=2897159 RepID=A0A9X1YLT6_9BURK|nr:enterotoxin [Scleromatobacter humisilvae]MCK9687810.1 enterotoxin [Scleromatobacter humisilvae]
MPVRLFASLLALTFAPAFAATPALPAPWLPLEPGAAHCGVADGEAELRNIALRFALGMHDGALTPTAFDNGFAKAPHALKGELFSVTTRDKKRTASGEFRLDSAPVCEVVAGRPDAARAAERHAGVALRASLSQAGTGLRATWRAVLRDGADYVREEVRFESATDLDIAQVALLDLDLDKAWTAGTTTGSVVVADDRFFGFEHPMAETRIDGAHALQFVRRVLPLRAHVPVDYSAVFGAAPPGQLRRGFTAYLENERATPFRTFLHYNSWYDIGYFTPYSEQEAVHVIDTYGRKLVKERGVKMDSFLFDDGWDDHRHLWQFNEHFPHGFTPVREAAERVGAEPGVWLSPWGGYGPPRQERLAAAKAGGFEVDDQGLALSGPKYYALFHDATMGLLKDYGINQFKLDGTGSPDKVTPGSAFDSDFAAAIALIGDLRQVKPDLFVNLTTGTWPSPFWLRTADSIWRGGEDHEFAGVGSNRQRWITYRDADTYGGIVRLGPLYPLNSLMLHGIVYARSARGLNVDPSGDFRSEVRSYFASGTGLQEMYVSPDLLTERNWDDLATAARWARDRAATLRDSHWIGGDPARLQVYGWASWSPGAAIVALRNPSDQPQDFALDIGAALELPRQEARTWNARPAYEQASPRPFTAGQPASVHLAPFQVLVWELSPVR